MESNKKDNRTDDDRTTFRNAKKKLNQTVTQAKRKILERDTKDAYDLIFHQLSTQKQSLGGENSIFLLPGLLVIAQTHIAEDRSKKAQEYLTAAYWNFLKHNKPDQKDEKNKSLGDLTTQQFNYYKTSLHRTFSKLYILKKQYNDAIGQIQNAAYMDSSSYGPQHPRTTINYYLLGKIFEQSGREQQAQSFYGKVSQIWYKYLKNYLKLDPETQQIYQTDSLLLQEAITFLKEIEKYFDKKYSGDNSDNNRNLFIPIMRTQYSIGLLYKVFGQHDVCRQYLKEVYRRCQTFLPQDDENTQEVKSDLQDLGPQYDDYDNMSRNQSHADENSNAHQKSQQQQYFHRSQQRQYEQQRNQQNQSPIQHQPFEESQEQAQQNEEQFAHQIDQQQEQNKDQNSNID